MQIYYDRDAQPALLRGKRIAMLGYGSQGHAQAQNLRDSGYSVVVGLPTGRNSARQAVADGLEVLPAPDAVRRADLVPILVPDEHHRNLFENEIRPNFNRLREQEKTHPVEQVGQQLRAMMSWLKQKQPAVQKETETAGARSR